MGDIFKGDERAPSTYKSTAETLRAYAQYLPRLLNVTSNQALPVGQTLQNAQNVLAPQEQALNFRIFDQYNPLYAQSAARTEADLIQGAGGEAVLASDRLNRLVDPEYYSGRAATGRSLEQLLGGMDPNRLTGAESANVERGLARQRSREGNLSTPNNLTAIQSALGFDDRLQQKRSGVSQAINAAAGTLPTFRSGVDTFGQATGRSGTQAFGSQFGRPSTVGDQVFDSGNQFVQGVGQLRNQENAINANRRSVTDYVNAAVSSAGSAAGGACCFIFLEAFNGKLPWWVRECRDEYYASQPRVAEGYKNMAKWLVPLMRTSSTARFLVNWTMVKPLTFFGGYKKAVPGYDLGWLTAPIKAAWFAIWKF